MRLPPYGSMLRLLLIKGRCECRLTTLLTPPPEGIFHHARFRTLAQPTDHRGGRRYALHVQPAGAALMRRGRRAGSARPRRPYPAPWSEVPISTDPFWSRQKPPHKMLPERREVSITARSSRPSIGLSGVPLRDHR